MQNIGDIALCPHIEKSRLYCNIHSKAELIVNYPNLSYNLNMRSTTLGESIEYGYTCMNLIN